MQGLLLLQANLNHSVGAQDLFVQTLTEWNIDMAVAAEPYRVPVHPNWAGDEDGSVAITWRMKPQSPPLRSGSAGKGDCGDEMGEAAHRGLLLLAQ